MENDEIGKMNKDYLDEALPLQRLPLLIQLGLTYRCNYKCLHCYANERRNHITELSLSEIRGIFQQLYNMGSCAIVYSHGESLIRRDFYQAAALADEFGFYQTLMTNGYYISSANICQQLSDSGIKRIMISLDSSDRIWHDKQRSFTGAYDRVLTSIPLLKEVGIPTVGFSMAIGPHNYDQVTKVIHLALKLGIDAISLMPIRNFNGDLWDIAGKQDYSKIRQKIYDLCIEYSDKLEIYTHDPLMLPLLDARLSKKKERDDYIGANMCNVGIGMISIDPIGDVRGCNFLPRVIDNVRDNSIESIWEKLLGVYGDPADLADQTCCDCNYRKLCQGGCKAFQQSNNRDQRCIR